MNQKQMPDDARVGSQNPVHDEVSVLRDQNAALREDNEDLRASALWWKALYEEAQQRCIDLESSLKPRLSSRNGHSFSKGAPLEPDSRGSRSHYTRSALT
jgi:hypothetical protein